MSNLEVGCVGWAINEDQPSLGVWMMMVGWLVGWGLFGSLSILKKSSGGPIEEEGKRRDALLSRRIEDLMRCFRSFVA